MKSQFCIKCNSEIVPVYPEILSGKPEQGMWVGGIVDKIVANYGSTLDGDVYLIAICDGCVKDNKLEKLGNYIN